LNDSNLNYFAELLGHVSDLENRYLDIIDFLKYTKNSNSESKFIPFDLPNMQLGKKKFFNEFKNFIKIVPKTKSPGDYVTLNFKIKEVLLEDSDVKSMSHWDLYSFHKFFLSFTVDEENLDLPYIKLYTRDKAEAAHLSFSLMDKDYVEIL
jgi:hypothetical protein